MTLLGWMIYIYSCLNLSLALVNAAIRPSFHHNSLVHVRTNAVEANICSQPLAHSDADVPDACRILAEE